MKLKRILSLVLSIVLLLGMMTTVQVSAEMTAIDLSATAKTVLAVGDTSQILVNGETNPEGVSYSSSRTAVAEVSSTGLVTAKANGLAVITASYGSLSKSIVMMVGESKKTESFDGTPSDTTFTALDTATKREGTGSWKLTPTAAKQKISLAQADAEGQTVSFWFYDDGSDGYKGIFDVIGSTWTTSDGTWRKIDPWLYVNFRNNNIYAIASANNGFTQDVKKDADRSTGWHQVVVENNSKTVSVYIDGAVYLSGAINETVIAEGHNTINIFQYSSDSGTVGSVWVDDFASADTTEVLENTYFATGKGDGTESKPYELTTADDIAKLAELMSTSADVRSAYYKLMNDIDLSSLTGFQGLGTFDGYYFTGTFDGNGYVIKNMTMSSLNQIETSQQNRPRGLFQATKGATVKNLGIENASVTGFPAGGIAGHDEGSTYENCFVRNSSIIASNGTNNYNGGIIGGAFYNSTGTEPVTTFINCYTSGLTIGAEAGGLKGCTTWTNVTNAKVANCYTTHERLISIGSSSTADRVGLTVDDATVFVGATGETVTAAALGSAFIANTTSYNSGLPVLAWEESRLPEEEPEEPDVTDETTNEYFTTGKGNGTADAPYELTTAEDLKKMPSLLGTKDDNGAAMRSAHYKLMNDIDMSSVTDFKGLTTISDYRGTFSGTFDGNGHVISNITVDRTADGDTVPGTALFMGLDQATIKNLGIENANVTGYAKTAVIACDDKGGSIIENCYVKNSAIKNTYAWGKGYNSAGMVGAPAAGDSGITTFKNCYVLGLTTTTRNGGAESDFVTSATNGAFKGAIVGQEVVQATMINCYTDHKYLTSTGSNGDDTNNTGYTATNCYKEVTASAVTASDLGSAFIANRTSYNNGLPVLAWEESRLPKEIGVSFAVYGNGIVKNGDDEITNGSKISTNIGSELTLTLIPDEDYIAKVTVDGEEQTVTDNKVTIKVTSGTGEIEIRFLHKELGIYPDPDTSILESVIDQYITKDGLTNQLAKYTFDTEADVTAWTISDNGGKIKEATQSWDEAGANGTTGAYKHVATGGDYRPRIIGPDKFTWKKGSTYEITAWIKGYEEKGATFAPWLDSDYTVYTDTNPTGGKYYGHGNKTLTEEWTKQTWKFTINDIKNGDTSVSELSSAYMTRFGGNDPVGTLWMDEITITETVPGYTKLGLKADSTLLFPDESVTLTVVGNNGIASYKVAPEGLTFASSNNEIATVDENGVVTAKSNGLVRIAVSDGEIMGTIDITISDENDAKEELHIALDGSDETGDGSVDAPFATIEKAKEVIRGFRRLPVGGVTVYIHEGEYVLDDTLTFTGADSGTKNAPITYKAYGDDVVDFVGAKKIDASKIQQVTDEDILDRLIEDHAKDNLYMLDLEEQGITMSAIAPYGWGTVDTPTRIFMNGTGLINARWPNDDKTGSQYFTDAKPAELSEEDAAIYNGARQPSVLQYVDEENRSAKWNIKTGDAMVGGCIAYLWAAQNLRIDSLDAENKIVTTLDNSAYSQATYTTDRYLYFSNIFEEIDMPGESYVDREEGILYFYPVGTVTGAEMEVSVLNKNMVEVKGASNIIFDGINFRNGRKDAIVIDANSDSITVKNAEISGMSKNGIDVNGKNMTIEGNHIYDIGAVGIELTGGVRETLESSGTVIKNNKLHNMNHYYPSHMCAIHVQGVGHVISHNEIFDINTNSIVYDQTNNTITEYNHLYDSEMLNADGGVLYWGRDIAEFGNIVRYNYFHDIGSHIGEHGQQSIFTDDGNIGPAIYGNVFYKGGLPNFTVKTNGGQFHNIHHNIFVGAPAAFYMQPWGNHHSGIENSSSYVERQSNWWIYMHDMRDVFGNANTSRLSFQKDLIWSDFWKEYYSSDEMVAVNPQWKLAFDEYLKEDMYNEAKALYDANNLDGLRDWLIENVPERFTNLLENNLTVNVDAVHYSRGAYVANNNLELKGAEGEAIFEDYGTDFNLTADGLAKVRQTISDFPDIDFDAIGAEYEVGGAAPEAIDVYIFGTPIVGSELTAKYVYSDEDGDEEGVSKIYWYVSDSEDGEYTRITEGYGEYFTVPAGYEGKYIRAEVVPYDSRSIYGEAAVSEAVYVDKQDNALLSDLKVNGKTVTGFNPSKVNYMVTANEVPEIDAIPAAEGAAVAIVQNGDTLPMKFTITVVAIDGKTTKTYVVAVSSGTTTSPGPTVTPTVPGTTGSGTVSSGIGSVGSSAGIAGGIGNGSGTGATTNQFTDISGHWAENDIAEMTKKGIVSGVTASTFEPDRSITRAEFAALVTRALKLSALNTENVFEDVASDAWYANEVAAAAAAGLIVGYDGNFRPDDTITREEMAVVIMKAYVFSGKSPLTGEIDRFADKDTISEWAAAYVDQAVSSGLISGITSDTFAPSENATRAQVTSLIKRLLAA